MTAAGRFYAVLLSVGLPIWVFAQGMPADLLPSRQILAEIRAHEDGVAVWWTGHNGWLIKAGGVLLGTDLVLEAADRIQRSPVTTAELAGELDISFVTHEHGDHFNNKVSRELARSSDCMFVVPQNCVAKARELGIPEDRIRVAVPGEPFEIQGVRVLPIRALHGHKQFSLHSKANFEDCGYLITIGGKTFLQPGDSILLQDHLELENVDVLFFSPTEHNMHIRQSVILINELEPDYILPQHRDTYRQTPENRYWANGYPVEVRTHLSRTLQERYHILEQGECLLVK
ncbi:MAG: MBL fold metallo-hydrolase [Candidatus Glassbacteria bacterium]|nr:MBL fold metallo-hydrolase [Candidatus Glassbacteria bacterium]